MEFRPIIKFGWMQMDVMECNASVTNLCYKTHNKNLTIDAIAKQMDTEELLFKYDKLWSWQMV